MAGHTCEVPVFAGAGPDPLGEHEPGFSLIQDITVAGAIDF